MTPPATPLDRLWAGFRTLVLALTAPTRFYATYEYTITATDGTTVDATPNDTTTGMPPVNKAELRADTIGVQTPAVGNLCHIIFTDGNPAKPKCSWCQPQPTSVVVGAGATTLARGPSVAQLVTDLGTFAGAAGTATSVAQVAAAAATLADSLTSLPPLATSVLEAG